MVIPNEKNKKTYTGNDVADTFVYDWPIFANTDLEVIETLISTGAETILTIITDYTVTGVGEATGGNVVLVAGALPSTKKVTIRLKPPLTQTTDYKEHDPFPAETHEKALDKIVNQVKSIKEETARSVQGPVTETDPLIIPALVANQLLSNDGSVLFWSAITGSDYNGSLLRGLDANKAAAPNVGDIYIATDTKRVYMCFVAGVWSVTNHFFGLDANKAVTPVVGEIYLATDTKLLYTCLSAGVWNVFTVETIEKTFTEAAHGFAAKDVVKFDGVNWVKAQADSEANAEYSWIVKSVTANTFVAVWTGHITDLAGLVAGSVYYLDDDTAGLLTTTEPTDNNDVSKPMLLALSTTTGIVLNQRGRVVGSLGSLIRDTDGDTKVETEQAADEDIARITAGGVEGGTFYGSGIADFPKQSRCRVGRTSTQNVASGSFQKLQLNVVQYDEQNEFDETTNYRFTATKAGKYFVVANGAANGILPDDYAEISVHKNGSVVCRRRIMAYTSSSAAFYVDVSDVIDLSANDYLEVFIIHNKGSDLAFSGDTPPTITYCAIHKLS